MKVCVAQDQDFQDQIGSHLWFDLMDPEKVSFIPLLFSSLWGQIGHLTDSKLQ